MQMLLRRARLTGPTARRRSSLPPSLAIPGALRIEVRGRNAQAAVADVDARLVEDLAVRWNASVSVEDLNLEEIFLEIHDDSRSESRRSSVAM